MRWIVGSSQKYRRLVLGVALALMVFGFIQLRNTAVEALPEFGPVRVDVQVEALGLSAEEVENLITNPIENEFFNGIPWLAKLESRTIPGLSSMEMTFEPGTDPIQARQVVQERLTMTPQLPQASSKPPLVVQPLSSTGRLMMISLTGKGTSLIDMSLLSRWTIVPRLLSVPGVANVGIWGFRDRQLQVQVDPSRLMKNGVTLDQVLRTSGNALWVSPLTFIEASTPGLGGFVDTANQRIEIQHNQPIKSAQELGKVTIQGAEDRQLHLADVATITEDHQLLIGDAVVGDDPGLLLVVERFPGTKVTDVTDRVEAVLADLRPGLGGIQVDTTLYRPASFIDQMVDNLVWRFVVAAVLVLLVVAGLFFSWRMAVVSLVTIGVSVSTTVLVLSWFGVPLNMMSIAGLVMALAVVVDDAIVGAETTRRRLHSLSETSLAEGTPRSGLPSVVGTAISGMYAPLAVAALVAGISVVPLLVLDGVQGAFVTPVAKAFIVAVVVSLVVALTVGTALATVLLARPGLTHSPAPLAQRLENGYSALLPRLVGRVAVALPVAIVLIVAGAAAVPFLGDRPLSPTLQERDLLIAWETAPGTSGQEMNRITGALTRELRDVPGVRNVGAHVGRALASDQVVNINSGEVWLSIDPAVDYAITRAAVLSVVDGYPGVRSDLLTYSDKRAKEVQTRSVSEDLVVRIYGNDYSVLNAKAQEVLGLVRGVNGVVEPHVNTAQVSPTVEIEVSVDKAAKYGLKPGDVRRQSATLVAATVAGNLFEEQKVFEVVVWGIPEVRRDLTTISNLMIDAPIGGAEGAPTQVRLADIADVRVVPKPEMIWHDQVSRSIDVVANVRGRSVGAVTQDVQNITQNVTFPREHHLEVLADSQSQADAGIRVWTYAGAVALAVFFLLQALFNSWRLALLSFLILPVALSGGALVALAVRDGLSDIALLGLVAVLTVAVRGTTVQVRHYQSLQRDGRPPQRDVVMTGTRERFVPALAGLLAAAMALAPFVVLGVATGLEIVMPLAAIVLGGLLTTALANLVVLPGLVLVGTGQPRDGKARRPDETGPRGGLGQRPDADTSGATTASGSVPVGVSGSGPAGTGTQRSGSSRFDMTEEENQ
jgi:Cu/Ag efflux pump CusA